MVEHPEFDLREMPIPLPRSLPAATLGDYLDNALLARPHVSVDQMVGAGMSPDYGELDNAPGSRGLPLILIELRAFRIDEYEMPDADSRKVTRRHWREIREQSRKLYTGALARSSHNPAARDAVRDIAAALERLRELYPGTSSAPSELLNVVSMLSRLLAGPPEAPVLRAFFIETLSTARRLVEWDLWEGDPRKRGAYNQLGRALARWQGLKVPSELLRIEFGPKSTELAEDGQRSLDAFVDTVVEAAGAYGPVEVNVRGGGVGGKRGPGRARRIGKLRAQKVLDHLIPRVHRRLKERRLGTDLVSVSLSYGGPADPSAAPGLDPAASGGAGRTAVVWLAPPPRPPETLSEDEQRLVQLVNKEMIKFNRPAAAARILAVRKAQRDAHPGVWRGLDERRQAGRIANVLLSGGPGGLPGGARPKPSGASRLPPEAGSSTDPDMYTPVDNKAPRPSGRGPSLGMTVPSLKFPDQDDSTPPEDAGEVSLGTSRGSPGGSGGGTPNRGPGTPGGTSVGGMSLSIPPFSWSPGGSGSSGSGHSTPDPGSRSASRSGPGTAPTVSRGSSPGVSPSPSGQEPSSPGLVPADHYAADNVIITSTEGIVLAGPVEDGQAGGCG